MDLQILITRIAASLFVLLVLTVPWIYFIHKNRDFIKAALAGVDGVTDATELRIGLGYLVLVCFIIVFFYLIITSGALGWQYDDIVYLYTFLGALGAEVSIVASIIDKIKTRK